MLKNVTINIDWSSMIDGASESDIAKIDKKGTIASYEEMVEKSLRNNHNKINADTEIDFTYDNPRYSHETDNGLDGDIQEILETIWDSQSFWVENND